MKFLLFLILTLQNIDVFAQDSLSSEKNSIYEIFSNPEQMPEFPGDVYAFISKHQGHPVDKNNQTITGRVVVRFDILEDGKIVNIRVIKTVHPAIDKDAISIVKKMPRWKPGSVNGKIVKTPFTIPIKYE